LLLACKRFYRWGFLGAGKFVLEICSWKDGRDVLCWGNVWKDTREERVHRCRRN
jgi:hypothetical protein